MDFLLTLFGAVVGGAISLATTIELQSRQETKVRKAHAIALILKVVEACDEIHKIQRHIAKNITKNGHLVVPQNRYYERIMELLGINDIPMSYNPEGLGIIFRKEHDDIVNGVIEIIRARNISVCMIVKYNELKKQLDDELTEIGDFEVDGEVIHLNANFIPNEHPALMGKIYKANILIGSLYEMTTEVVEKIAEVCPRLNDELPTYFPKGTKLRKVTLPAVV